MSCLLKVVTESGVKAPSDLEACRLHTAKGGIRRKLSLIISGLFDEGFLDPQLLIRHLLAIYY
jgi:hypothetical protein